MNSKILEEANKLIINENLNSTYLEGVNLYKISESIKKAPLVYDICIIILLQGEKTIFLNDKQFTYNKENYLVVPTTLPVECESMVSPDEPILAMTFEIDKMKMLDVISSLSAQEKKNSDDTFMGIFEGKVNDSIEDIIYRLLKVLQSEEESRILGESIIKELYYRIAVGENAHFLHHMFIDQKKETKIAKSLKNIHDNYNKSIDIETLARSEDMSISSFHKYFKEITTYSPLQYIKKMRLNKAKELIEKKALQVNDTAYEVGYVSVSQFSRDFKSYFGYPPKEAKAS